jgi:hypothetical protein
LEHIAKKIAYFNDAIIHSPIIFTDTAKIVYHLMHQASILETGFTDESVRNTTMHRELASCHQDVKNMVAVIKATPRAHHGSILTTCDTLLEQIREEIATNSISSLNGNPGIFRSHYFDFIDALKEAE